MPTENVLQKVFRTVFGGGNDISLTNPMPVKVIGINHGPSTGLNEDWLDGIDPTLWTKTDPATGSAWTLGVNNGVKMITAIPNASEHARLVSNRQWLTCLGAGSNLMMKKFVVECEMSGAGFANVDQTKFIMGMTPGLADDKSSANVVGFTVSNLGKITSYSSNGILTEETWAGADVLPTAYHKYRMEMHGIAGGAGQVDYYVDDLFILSHTGIHVPSGPMYRQIYFPTNGGGAATIIVGGQRFWYQDY